MSVRIIQRKPQPEGDAINSHQLTPLSNLKVHVHARENDLEYHLFKRCGVRRAANVEEADIICFVGGADVNPLLYGEEPLDCTEFSVSRDAFDLGGWRFSQNKLKVGICRGGQFLNVMNGGKLWQNVDNHCGVHHLTDRFTGEKFAVSSTHHQQFRPGQKAVVVATARETTFKHSEGHRWKLKDNGQVSDEFFKIDHEVLWYPETKSLCFQPHPEYADPISTAVYFNKVLWNCIGDKYPNDAIGHSFIKEINKEKA